VTGGSGFIGGRLIERLVSEGRQVRALARSPAAAERVAALGAEPVRGELAEVSAMRAGAEGCDWAFHAAATVGDWGMPEEFERGNVTGTRNALEACTQAVLTEAQQTAGSTPGESAAAQSPYTAEELRAYLGGNATTLRATAGAPYAEIAATLDRLSEEIEEHVRDLQRLEQRLTVLEEKMLAVARASQTEEHLLKIRQDLDADLRPYRSKMSAPQLAMLEKQYLERRLLERQGLPRLSLFYMR